MLLFFLSVYLFFSSFNKKLICLLSLEIMMIILISLFFFSSFNSLGVSVFSTLFFFICFMVLDSVLGISLLIGSVRTSSNILNLSKYLV